MKKIWDLIKNFFTGTGENAVVAESGDLMDAGLESLYATKPKTCIALVSTLHAWTPILAELAAKTKTDFDDKEVGEIQKEIEAFATAKGFSIVDFETAAVVKDEAAVATVVAPTESIGEDPAP